MMEVLMMEVLMMEVLDNLPHDRSLLAPCTADPECSSVWDL
jgi:hypothetical protein